MNPLLQIKKLHKKYSEIYEKGLLNIELLSKNSESTLIQKNMNRAWKMIVNDLNTITEKLEYDIKEK